MEVFEWKLIKGWWKNIHFTGGLKHISLKWKKYTEKWILNILGEEVHFKDMFLFRHPEKMGEQVEDEFTSTMRSHILMAEQGSWGTKLTHKRHCEHHKVYLLQGGQVAVINGAITP